MGRESITQHGYVLSAVRFFTGQDIDTIDGQNKTPSNSQNETSYELCPHSFDSAIKKMKEFAEGIPTQMELSRFETKGGLFKLGKHKVTGDEMNDYSIELQEWLTAVNGWVIRLSEQFPEIYHAINALDKEYIQGILSSMETAKRAQQDASVSIEGLKSANEKINDTLDALKRTIIELQKFKKETTSLNDIRDSEMAKLQKTVEDLKQQMIENEKQRSLGLVAIIISIVALFASILVIIMLIMRR